MTVLLDANVLIALLVDDHVHHGAAENWFVGMSGNFATCPITQGSLMPLLVREGQPTSAAREVLNGTSADPRHEFWPDEIPYTDVPIQGIVGHRQSDRRLSRSKLGLEAKDHSPDSGITMILSSLR